jgi:S1-C subfamily serine protease
VARGIAGLLAAGILVLSCAAGGNAAADAPGRGAARGRVKSGTGFFVAPAGLVVTSRHVVAGCPGILVWTDDGRLYDARLVASDAQRDLALLAVQGRGRGYAASRYRDDPRRGERVVTVGFGVVASNPKEAVFARGTFVGRGVMPPGYHVLIVRADLHPGDSGAPVTDRSGSLLGMVIGRLADRSDLGVVITAGEIARFLSRAGAEGLARAAAASRTGGSDASVARISTLVQCRPVADRLPSRRR